MELLTEKRETLIRFVHKVSDTISQDRSRCIFGFKLSVTTNPKFSLSVVTGDTFYYSFLCLILLKRKSSGTICITLLWIKSYITYLQKGRVISVKTQWLKVTILSKGN